MRLSTIGRKEVHSFARYYRLAVVLHGALSVKLTDLNQTEHAEDDDEKDGHRNHDDGTERFSEHKLLALAITDTGCESSARSISRVASAAPAASF